MKVTKTIVRIILLWALVGGLLVLTVGCSKKEPEQKGPAAETAKDKQAEKTSAAVSQPEDKTASTAEKKKSWTLSLEREDKRDPFAIIASPEITDTEDATELYDLDQMLLQGIILDRSGKGNHIAFIKIPSDPSGKSDRMVRLGDRLGKQNGVVDQIASNHIVVKEQWYDPEKEKPIIHFRTMEIFDPTKVQKKR